MWNYIGGCVKIHIEGLSLEKFLNICNEHDLHIWDIKRETYSGMTAWMYAQSFKQLRVLLRGRELKIHILDKRGLPFLTWRMRERIVLYIGGLLCIAALIIASQFIWSIKIEGNNHTSEQLILEHVQKFAHVGMHKSKLEMSKIGNELELSLDSIAWAGARLTGSSLTISIVEKQEAPSPEIQRPSNIIATKSGMLTRITVLNGIAQKKEGDLVKSGDVIISGTIPGGQSAATYYVTARGEVLARAWYTGEANITRQTVMLKQTGNTEFAASITLGTATMHPDSAFEKYESEEIDKQGIYNLYLPLEIVLHKRSEIAQFESTLSDEQMKTLAEESAWENVTAQVPTQAKITNKSISARMVDGRMRAVAVVETIENIGKSIEIDIIQSPTEDDV